MSLREVVFTLRVRHAVTGRAVPALRATLVPPTPWWWSLATADGLVGVHALDRHVGAGAAPVVRLSITDPLVALVVVDPVVELALTAPDTTHEYVPVPQTVTVDLVDAQGTPSDRRLSTGPTWMASSQDAHVRVRAATLSSAKPGRTGENSAMILSRSGTSSVNSRSRSRTAPTRSPG